MCQRSRLHCILVVRRCRYTTVESEDSQYRLEDFHILEELTCRLVFGPVYEKSHSALKSFTGWRTTTHALHVSD